MRKLKRTFREIRNREFNTLPQFIENTFFDQRGTGVTTSFLYDMKKCHEIAFNSPTTWMPYHSMIYVCDNRSMAECTAKRFDQLLHNYGQYPYAYNRMGRTFQMDPSVIQFRTVDFVLQGGTRGYILNNIFVDCTDVFRMTNEYNYREMKNVLKAGLRR